MEQEQKKKINWRRTFKNNAFMVSFILKSCPGVVIMATASTVLNAVHSFLLHTYLYQYALNALQEGKALREILITLGVMFGFSILYWVFRRLSDCYFAVTRPKVEVYIQRIIQKKTIELDLACYESSAFYDVYVKAVSETTDRAYKIMNSTLDLVYSLITFGAVGTLIVTIDPIFLLLAVLPLAFTLFIGKRRNRIRYDYSMRTKEAARQRDYVRRTFYLRDYAKEMRLTDMWQVMFARMHKSIAEMKAIVDEYGYKMMFFRYFFDFVYDVFVSSGTIVLAAYKTLVLKNMLLGDCFVVIRSITNIAANLEYFGSAFFGLDEHSLYVDNLRIFLNYEVKIFEDKNAPLVPSFESLELRDVSFFYEGKDKAALSHVDLKVKAGERIAIVGHNGAGKTTLIKLLQRLYDANEGEILLNGESIKSYRLSSYRDMFGTVFQDYKLFATTVAENVLLRGNITDEDRETVREALRRTGIYDKIEKLPDGVDTNVTREFDSEGAMFSGGEAQKISIARLFAGKKEIVIMDEPTSALDPIAEQEMYRNMFEACEGKTVIFISHRLSSATMADRVYMFEQGEIIEQGTHAELLAMNGKYADMWHKQADTYADLEEVSA
ncbi:MAG: ABC transporter ATP-binding protein [Clostridia bacterium]|nr:ABC transporter ATP-binding protein [Clostridia bacterium]